MTDSSFIKTTLKEYISAEISGPSGQTAIGDETKLIESGVLDSLSVLKLVTFLEERFAIRVDPDEVVSDNFETLASLTNLVSRKLDRQSKKTNQEQK